MNLSSLTIRIKSLPSKLFGEASFNPQRDWLILMSVGVLVLLILLTVQTVGFWQTLEEEERAVSKEQGGNERPTETLKVLFEERKAEQVRYDTEYRFIDPSR